MLWRFQRMLTGRQAIRWCTLASAVALLAMCGMVALASSLAVAQSRDAAPPGAMSATGEPVTQLLCVHDVAPTQRLPVHAGPGSHRPQTGAFPGDGCGIRLEGSCRGDWCDMALGDVRGWVDTRFVAVYEVPGPAPAAHEAPAAASPAPSAPVLAASAIPLAPPGVTRAEQPSPPHVEAESAARRERAEAQADPLRRLPASRAGACVAGVARRDTLRIRTGPGARYGEVAGIPSRACQVERIGGCRGSWCRVAWRGHVGWVNAGYLE